LITRIDVTGDWEVQMNATPGMYCVYRAVGDDIWEAYVCDTKEEVMQMEERMSAFAGEIDVLQKEN